MKATQYDIAFLFKRWAVRSLVYGGCGCRVFYKKFQLKLTDPEVCLHVILLNFSVFVAGGVPPDPHGDVKGNVKKIQTRISQKT